MYDRLTDHLLQTHTEPWSGQNWWMSIRLLKLGKLPAINSYVNQQMKNMSSIKQSTAITVTWWTGGQLEMQATTIKADPEPFRTASLRLRTTEKGLGEIFWWARTRQSSLGCLHPWRGQFNWWCRLNPPQTEVGDPIVARIGQLQTDNPRKATQARQPNIWAL